MLLKPSDVVDRQYFSNMPRTGIVLLYSHRLVPQQIMIGYLFRSVSLDGISNDKWAEILWHFSFNSISIKTIIV